MKTFFLFFITLAFSFAAGAQNVGINNTDPQYPLDVNGRIHLRYTDAFYTPGIWFSKTDNMNASFLGQLNDTTVGIFDNAAASYKFLFDHKNGNFSLTNTLKGIIMNAADGPIITKGWDAFTSGPYQGIGRWGMFKELGTLAMGIPDLAGANFSVAAYDPTGSISKNLMIIKQNGNVGIGVNTPLYPLDVNGRIHLRYTDAFYTPGIWFSKSDNTNASFFGQSNDSTLGVYDNAAATYKFLFDHKNGNLSLTNSDKGVILNAGDKPLITRGWNLFTSGAYSGLGRWGMFMEPSRLTMGIPNAPGYQFGISAYDPNSSVAKNLFVIDAGGNAGLGVNPNASAMLDISSANKGLLIPRVTLTGTSDIATVPSPLTSLLVFNTATAGSGATSVTPGYYYWNSGAWSRLALKSDISPGWSLTGNAGTTDGTEFIGTTDNVPFNIKVNNQRAGRLDPISGNTFWGYRGGLVNSGTGNTFLGESAGRDNTSGSTNIFIGQTAGLRNTIGYSNVAIGRDALAFNQSSSHLVAIGDSALFNNTAQENTAMGSKSLFNNTVGISNTAVGYFAEKSNQSGSDNTALGWGSLVGNINGNRNVGIGNQALVVNQTGSNNTAIGYNAGVSTDGLLNATAIGSNATVSASNSLILGGIGVNAVKVGIGVSAPLVTLHVKGSANFFTGADSHTGNFYNGNSSTDGFEVVSSGSDCYLGIQRASGYALHVTKPNVTTNNGLVGFIVNTAVVGSITTNGVNTAYNTTSDIRLKENIVATNYGLNTLIKLNVADYNYKSDNKKTLHTGFIAQELYKLYPQAVQVGGADPLTNPWQVDYSKITPLLVKSVQEQQNIINEQEKKIKNMEEKIEKLSKAVESLMHK